MIEYPIIELDKVDSTNKYAMQLIDADKALHGLTITAKTQDEGRGQRGRIWHDEPGKSLLMTIILTPKREIGEQFVFNSYIAATIANVLQKLNNAWQINIKWPNDIIIDDKKAGGILIENVLRGSRWTHSVVGIGLNINHDVFPAELPFATSLKIAGGMEYSLSQIRTDIVNAILTALTVNPSVTAIMSGYNHLLYMRDKWQLFSQEGRVWHAKLRRVLPDGKLEVLLADNEVVSYYHGQAIWQWGGA